MAHPRLPSERLPSEPAADGPVGHRPDELLAELRPPPPVTLGERLEVLLRRPRAVGLRAAAVAVAVVVAAGAGWWLLRPPAPPIESTLPLAGTEAGPGGAAAGPGTGAGGAATPGAGSSTTTPQELVVQAAGAVAHPGVYRLAAGGRVDDVVREAGGLAPEADLDRVNLAAPVADGERVWIPRRGEAEPPAVVAGGGAPVPAPMPGSGGGTGGPSGAGAPTPPAVVDLNTADADALDTLPGVGPSTAAAILAYRDEHGAFSSVDELLEVRGIGEAKLEQLRPLVTV